MKVFHLYKRESQRGSISFYYFFITLLIRSLLVRNCRMKKMLNLGLITLLLVGCSKMAIDTPCNFQCIFTVVHLAAIVS